MHGNFQIHNIPYNIEGTEIYAQSIDQYELKSKAI
jgi:hypothetical protein